MVVPTHSLVAPPWINGRSMVISSLLNEHLNVFSFMSVFLRERTRHVNKQRSLVQTCCYDTLEVWIF